MPEEATVVERLGRLTARERFEHIWIGKLRRLPCFEQIVKRLADGRSVQGVARWLQELNPEGELKDVGFHTWRKYLYALKMRIEQNMAGVERKNPEPLAYKAVIEEFERQKEGEFQGKDDLPPAAEKIRHVVTDAVKKLDAATMLRYCFMVQQGRVETMLEIERKMKFLIPDGHKNLAVLKDIATDVMKLEIGEQWMRGRPAPLSGPYPDGSLPHPAPAELSPMAQEVAKFDAVDRNLMREIASKMIDEYEEAKASGRTAVGGLAADAGGKVGAQAEVKLGVRPDVKS
ncbi:MAG: hypothetical protein WBC04_06235 [Candidatus Acidiferrales bacterium]